MAVTGFTPNPAGMKQLEQALAFGFLNLGFAIEGAAKRNAPVRGGYRSFAPNGPVGGTLRRSLHTAAYLDGQKVGGASADENGNGVPQYPAGTGIICYVGTNIEYAAFVHNGTVKMPARPFLLEALRQIAPQAVVLITAGAQRHMGA